MEKGAFLNYAPIKDVISLLMLLPYRFVVCVHACVPVCVYMCVSKMFPRRAMMTTNLDSFTKGGAMAGRDGSKHCTHLLMVWAVLWLAYRW